MDSCGSCSWNPVQKFKECKRRVSRCVPSDSGQVLLWGKLSPTAGCLHSTDEPGAGTWRSVTAACEGIDGRAVCSTGAIPAQVLAGSLEPPAVEGWFTGTASAFPLCWLISTKCVQRSSAAGLAWCPCLIQKQGTVCRSR